MVDNASDVHSSSSFRLKPLPVCGFLLIDAMASFLSNYLFKIHILMSSTLTEKILLIWFYVCLFLLAGYIALSCLLFAGSYFEDFQHLIISNPISYLVGASVIFIPLTRKVLWDREED